MSIKEHFICYIRFENFDPLWLFLDPSKIIETSRRNIYPNKTNNDKVKQLSIKIKQKFKQLKKIKTMIIFHQGVLLKF